MSRTSTHALSLSVTLSIGLSRIKLICRFIEATLSVVYKLYVLASFVTLDHLSGLYTCLLKDIISIITTKLSGNLTTIANNGYCYSQRYSRSRFIHVTAWAARRDGTMPNSLRHATTSLTAVPLTEKYRRIWSQFEYEKTRMFCGETKGYFAIVNCIIQTSYLT